MIKTCIVSEDYCEKRNIQITMEQCNGNAIPVVDILPSQRRRSMDSVFSFEMQHDDDNPHVDVNIIDNVRHKLIPQYMNLIENSLKFLGLLPTIPVKQKCSSYLLLCYHVFVWCTSYSLFLVRFMSYQRVTNRKDMTIGISVSVLVTLHVIASMICVMVYMAFKFAQNRSKLYDLWEEYKLTHGGDWEGPLKRKVFVTFLFCWGFSLGYCVMIWMIYFISDSSRSFQSEWVVFSPLSSSPDGLIAEILTVAYNILFICHPTAIMYMMLGLFFILITDITHDFREMNAELEKNLDCSDPSEVHDTLSLFHKKHQLICDFLQEVDTLFSPMVLAVFVCGIFVICLAIYTAVLGPSSEHRYWILSITLPVASFFMTLMITLAIMGAKLSEAAYSAKTILFDIDCQRLDSHTTYLLEYSAFMSLLNTENLSITGWKLFMVNKSSINKMVILIVTYTVVLLKFDWGS